MNEWWVYVLTSLPTGRTYVGCTVDADRRLSEHNGELKGGAKSTRAGRPWETARMWGPYGSRSEAQSVEAEVKALNREGRLAWRPWSV